MRMLAVTVCMLLAMPALGQNKFLPSAGPERDKLLDAVLDDWEKAMTKVKSLDARCERVNDDKVFKTKEVYKGSARFLKGDGPGQPTRASLYLVKADNLKVYEHVILSGGFFYEVSPADREIRVHALPKPKAGENVDPPLFGLLFGMKAAQAKARYKIELAGADEHYYYLRIGPKLPADRADFGTINLVLLRNTHMPRQIQFEQANGNRVTWDLPSIETPANLRPADFNVPELPAGWKMNRIPVAGP